MPPKILVNDEKPIVRGVYLGLCINCGGEIDDLRLMYGQACSKCMRELSLTPIRSFKELASKVHNVIPNSRLHRLLAIEQFVDELKHWFEICVGSAPWNVQLAWMYRVAQGQSFAMIAPTGVGKTTFGLVTALYLASKGKKSYIIVPTTVLVIQYYEKLQEYMDRLGKVFNVIAIHSKISPKKRVELENEVRQGNFDILITTSMYLQRKFDTVFKPLIEKGINIDFVFVDDVDAILKGSKAIDYVLRLIGFSEEDLKLGFEIINSRREILYCEQRLEELRPSFELCMRKEKEDEKCSRIIEEVERCKSLLNKVKETRTKLSEKRKNVGIIIVSSATGRARGKRVRLFRELLGFDIGSRPELFRNIVDTYVIPPKHKPIEELVYELVKTLGTGGLVYVPVDKGIEYAEYIAKYLRDRGIKADTLVAGKSANLNKFVEGELDILVGVAIYYGLLVRGIDLPERVRYAIFVGIPRHKLSLETIDPTPQSLLRLMAVLVEVVRGDKLRGELERSIQLLRRIVRRYSPTAIKELVDRVKQGTIQSKADEVLLKAYNLVVWLIKQREIIEALKEYPRASIIEEDGKLYILIPDVPTYIQASGRTSRMFAGGITRGLSIVIVDDERLLRGLEYRARFYIDEFKLEPFENINLSEILKQIDEDRKFVAAVRRGEITVEVQRKELIRTALMIVESPNKARTIANFFGRPSARDIDGVRVYEVDIGRLHILIVASGGHVFDVIETDIVKSDKPNEIGIVYGVKIVRESEGRTRFIPIYGTLKRCLDCGHQFVFSPSGKCPLCGSENIRDSSKIIEVLQRLALEVDEVLIGTDPDAEGEKIGFDVALALAPYARNIKRIEFHEVTRKAILKALENPRPVDLRLVEAQITRRIEDRWLGFALSEYVTKKIGNVVEKVTGATLKGRLSAGRVQTPALGRVFELYIRNRLTTMRICRVETPITTINIPIEFLPECRVKKKVSDILEKLRIRFIPISTEITTVMPPPPFTTDTLLTEASHVLRLSAPKAMQIAQELFELGLITYHRTDSTRISSTGIGIAREYLENRFGASIAKKLFHPRTWGTGGAHEGIRPTRAIDVETLKQLIAEGVIELAVRLRPQHYALYDLIFRRFIASQMAPALVEVTTYIVEVEYNGNIIYRTTTSLPTKIVEAGFTLMYMPFKVVQISTTDETVLKPTRIRSVKVSGVKLPSQGDLVRWMKSVGVGRPSTYAKIIDVLLRRRYVVEHRNVLRPKIRGILVYLTLAGLRFPETKEEFMKYLDDLIEILASKRRKYKRVSPDELREIVKSAIVEAKPEIASMVSVERTSELQQYMQMIESNEVNYEDVLKDMFAEVCNLVLARELKKLDEGVCIL